MNTQFEGENVIGFTEIFLRLFYYEHYFSDYLDRQAPPTISVQINRKIDLTPMRSIFLIIWTEIVGGAYHKPILQFRVYQCYKNVPITIKCYIKVQKTVFYTLLYKVPHQSRTKLCKSQFFYSFAQNVTLNCTHFNKWPRFFSPLCFSPRYFSRRPLKLQKLNLTKPYFKLT